MSGPPEPGPAGAGPDGNRALELLEERLEVSRRLVQGQTVRIATTTHMREHLVQEQLARETVEIERVPIGRVVDATPDIRHEGDVTILPVMEEVLVVERRLVLKEEVRIRRIRTTALHRETVQLREQAACITRTDAGNGQASQPETTTPISQERDMP